MPLNGRNFSSVTLFQPGAVTTDPQGLVGSNGLERNTLNNGIVAVNGNRSQANNYTLDGVDMNEGQNNLIAYNPSPDAIAEINVISANAPATYGNVNGGDVVSVLKTGTNAFHGSAFAYLENQKLDANTWFNKDHPRHPHQSLHPDHLRRNHRRSHQAQQGRQDYRLLRAVHRLRHQHRRSSHHLPRPEPLPYQDLRHHLGPHLFARHR